MRKSIFAIFTLICLSFNASYAWQLIASGIPASVGTSFQCSPSSWDPADGTDGDANATQQFTCTATGSGTISSISITGGNGFVLDGTGNCTATTYEDEQCTIDMHFVYAEGGPYSDTLVIASDFDDQPENVSLGPVTVSAAGADANVLFAYGCEAVSATDSLIKGSGTVNSAGLAGTTTGQVGNGLSVNSTYQVAILSSLTNNFDSGIGTMGFWVNITAQSANTIIMSDEGNDTAPAFTLIGEDSTVGNLRWHYAGTNQSMAIGSGWHWVDLAWDIGNTRMSWQVDGGGWTENTSVTGSEPTIDNLALGTWSGTSGTYVFDHWLISDQYQYNLYQYRNSASGF